MKVVHRKDVDAARRRRVEGLRSRAHRELLDALLAEGLKPNADVNAVVVRIAQRFRQSRDRIDAAKHPDEIEEIDL